MSRYPPLDISNVKRYPFEERPTKVDIHMLGKCTLDKQSFADFFHGLPHILAASDLRTTAELTAQAISQQRLVLTMMGAHLVKTGLSPLFCELLKRKAIGCLTMNGAGIIHDFEMAMFGRTSEDVAMHLESGRFGYVKETAVLLNQAVREGAKQGWGYGESIARKLENLNPPHAHLSLTLSAWQNGIPLTVHPAIGTETIHQHPEADGAAIGQTSYLDFRILCQQLTRLEGGVSLLFGSAVILPEVFLKALTVVRNLGYRAHQFASVNFDMLRHYRSQENVVRRPTRNGGKGYTLIGHHELMIPLFWQSVFLLLKEKSSFSKE